MSLIALACTYLRRRILLSMSALCIALGVGVLYAVLAVVNGFLVEIESTLRDFGGDVIVRPASRGDYASSDEYISLLKDTEGVASLSPRVNWFGLVGRRGTRSVSDPRSADLSGLLLVGIEPSEEPADRPLLGSLTPAEVGALLSRVPGEPPPVLLGDEAARSFGVATGDLLEVISYRGADGRTPYAVRTSFQVAGTFDTGQYEQDLDRAVVRRSHLAEFAAVKSDFTDLVIRVTPGADPATVADSVQAKVNAATLAESGEKVQTWRDIRRNFLAAIENQRGILGTVFFFIVLVAAYQLLATLTLTVTEKRRDIGVMGALGAGPVRVAGFFVSLGLTIAISGIALGFLLGVALTANLDRIDNMLGGVFRAEVYQFDHIPIAVHAPSVVLLLAGTVLAAVVFSLVPAWRATRTPIVQALRSA